MNDSDRNAADLLHMLGHLYVKSGEHKRGLVLLLLAAHIVPTHPGILHTLTRAFIAVGDTGRALNAIDRLESLHGPTPTLMLLQSRALWAAGHQDEARRRFREYLTHRSDV